MFTTLVPLIFCSLYIYPRAWSIDAAPKCNVSQSLHDRYKHMLVDNRPIPDIPFQDIVDRFSFLGEISNQRKGVSICL